MPFNYTRYNGLIGNTKFEKNRVIDLEVAMQIPPIVTEGLVVWLDGNEGANIGANLWTNKVSGNTSYTFTGTQNTGTESGNTYFSNNGGTNGWSWQTDASVVNNFTWEIWCKPAGSITLHSLNTFTTGHAHLISADNRGDSDCGAGFSVGTNGVSGNEHANSYLSVSAQVTATISSTIPSLISFVYSNKTPAVYINGASAGGNVRTSSRTNVRSAGARIGFGDYGSFSGRYYAFRLYNRVLSATEISNNFNTERGRFGA